jgi:hypothetical protein
MQINLPLSEEFDCDLVQRVRAFLHQRGYACFGRLNVSVVRGIVEVQGWVPSFYLRQLAVACIKHVAGVTQIVDLIEVEDVPRSGPPNGKSDEPESAGAEHRVDSPDLTHIAQDTSRSQLRRRHLLSSAHGSH